MIQKAYFSFCRSVWKSAEKASRKSSTTTWWASLSPSAARPLRPATWYHPILKYRYLLAFKASLYSLSYNTDWVVFELSCIASFTPRVFLELCSAASSKSSQPKISQWQQGNTVCSRLLTPWPRPAPLRPLKSISLNQLHAPLLYICVSPSNGIDGGLITSAFSRWQQL